jgi:hypothetical protein
MTDAADGVHELVDAANVFARRDVVQAVAALAASPLEEQAADRMRAVLTRATSPTAAGRTGSSRSAAATKKTSLVCLPTATAAVGEEGPAVAVAASDPVGPGDVR